MLQISGMPRQIQFVGARTGEEGVQEGRPRDSRISGEFLKSLNIQVIKHREGREIKYEKGKSNNF